MSESLPDLSGLQRPICTCAVYAATGELCGDPDCPAHGRPRYGLCPKCSCDGLLRPLGRCEYCENDDDDDALGRDVKMNRMELTFTDEQLEAGARAMIEERNGVPLEQIDTNAMERAAILANTITDLEVALEAMRDA